MIFKKRPAMDLRCEKIDLVNALSLEKWTYLRCEYFKKILPSWVGYGKKILCITGPSDSDLAICNHLGSVYTYTEFELDEPFPLVEYVDFPDYLFAFEVIEHLMNPLLFLKELRKFNVPVVISFPSMPFSPFWGETHFHELSERSFLHLISEAGFHVKCCGNVPHNWTQWWKFFNGFRPVIRFVFLMFGYPKHFIFRIDPL